MALLNLAQLNTSQPKLLQTMHLWKRRCWSEGVFAHCWPLLEISLMILGHLSLFKADVPPYICFLMRWPHLYCWSFGPSRTGFSEVCCNVMLVQLQLILSKSSKQINKIKKITKKRDRVWPAPRAVFETHGTLCLSTNHPCWLPPTSAGCCCSAKKPGRTSSAFLASHAIALLWSLFL